MYMDIMLSSQTRSALFAVQNTVSKQERTQQRLQSGKAVNSAIDDAVKYFKSKNLTDRAKNFSDIKEGMDQAISMVSASNNGLMAIHSVYSQMKGIVEAAKTADTTTMQTLTTQWKDLFTQADSLATDSSYQGKSLVCPDTIPAGYNYSTYWAAPKDVGIPPTSVDMSPDPAAAKLNISTIPLPSVDPVLAANQAAPPPNPEILGYDRVLQIPGGGLGAVTINQNALDSVGHYVGDISTQHPDLDALTPGQTSTGWSLQVVVSGNNGTFIVNGGALCVQDQTTGNIVPYNDHSVNVNLHPFGPPTTLSNPIIIDQKSTAINPNGQMSATTFGITSNVLGNVAVVVLNNDPGPVQQPPYYNIGHPQTYLDPPVNLPAAETWCDKALSYINAAQSYFGSNITTIQNKSSFVDQYVNTLSEGSDKMTLADLNEEGANLVALQTRQQIGIQSISIAGQSQANIITLLNK